MPHQSTPLRFTATEGGQLITLRQELARQLRHPVELHRCADDGDESALFTIGDGAVWLVAVQTCFMPNGRRAFDLVMADGRSVPHLPPVASLSELGPLARAVAVTEFRKVVEAGT